MLRFVEFLNESLLNEDAKDEMRIKDLITKGEGSSTEKSAQLATNMAKAITDKDKSLRRFDAAKKILGDDNPITIIFGNRARELGNYVQVAKHVVAPKEGDAPKPIFFYDQQVAKEVWNTKFLPIVAKLSGRNWGEAFGNKLAKQFTLIERFNLVIYIEKNVGYGSHHRHQFPKLSDAVGSLKRRTVRPELLQQLDFGDAKVNPENPAHFLFTDERNSDVKKTKLEELKTAARVARLEFHIPENLFEPGEEYCTYSQQNGSTAVIKFNDPWAMYFWNKNMIGQMSDGYWENSRKYQGEWKYWVKLKPTFDPDIVYREVDSMQDVMNPKLVQQYALQTPAELETAGKIAVLKDKNLLSLLEYGKSYKIDEIGSIEKAEEIANSNGVDLSSFLAFLWEPGIGESKMKKIVSEAHTNMCGAMITR